MQRRSYYGYLTEEFRALHERITEEGLLKVWTDGSRGNAESVNPKAGAGIFHGNGNVRNRGILVHGKQTSQRAELTAILYLLQSEQRPLQIMTDSRYARDGIMHGMAKWKAQAWLEKPASAQRISNVDLWMRIEKLVRQRKAELRIHWVKGHAMPRHVQWKLTTEEDIWGNTAADGLAGKAAEQRKEIEWAKDSDELRLVPLRQPTGGKSESHSPAMMSKFVPLKMRQEVLKSENRKRERDEEERRNQIQGEEEGWDAIGDLFDQ